MDLYTIIYFIQSPITHIQLPIEITNNIIKYLLLPNYVIGYTRKDLLNILNIYIYTKQHNCGSLALSVSYIGMLYERFSIFDTYYFKYNTIFNHRTYWLYSISNKYQIKSTNISRIIRKFIKTKYKRTIHNIKRHQLIDLFNTFSIPIIHLYKSIDYLHLIPNYSYNLIRNVLSIYKNNQKIIDFKKNDKIDIRIHSYDKTHSNVNGIIINFGKFVKIYDNKQYKYILIKLNQFIYSYVIHHNIF